MGIRSGPDVPILGRSSPRFLYDRPVFNVLSFYTETVTWAGHAAVTLRTITWKLLGTFEFRKDTGTETEFLQVFLLKRFIPCFWSPRCCSLRNVSSSEGHMCRSDDPAGGLSPSSRYNDLTVLSLSDILSFSSFVSEGEGERKSLFHG